MQNQNNQELLIKSIETGDYNAVRRILGRNPKLITITTPQDLNLLEHAIFTSNINTVWTVLLFTDKGTLLLTDVPIGRKFNNKFSQAELNSLLMSVRFGDIN